ncbi:MAG: MtrAB system histidine kinase MtrB [Antricoccus sp.]
MAYYIGAAGAEFTLFRQRILRRWRQSLQLRIVALTAGITLAVIAIVGYILITQITTSLISVKQRAAIARSTQGVQYLQQQLQLVSGTPGGNINAALSASTQYLSQVASAAGIFRVITVQRDGLDNNPRVISVNSLQIDVIPTDLQRVIGNGKQAIAYATVPLDGSTQTVLIVGSKVPSVQGDFELYYIYPLKNEQDAVASVQQTTTLSGLALVVLIAGVGLLVSRLVVLPVRQAAQTAAQLAGGDLEQRMQIRGEDDLARLATSFNDMAASLSSQIVRLEELSKVQQRFTSDVSHELRTPLTTVRMAAEMLHDYREDFPEVPRRSAELLYIELDRFESLLKDLLEISRHDAGGLDLEAEPTDMVGLVKKVVDAHQAVAREHGVRLSFAALNGPLNVELNGRRIERVLRNLVSNAVEHGQGAPVEVTLAANDTAVAVTVRDHGVGINQAAAEHLFDRFWRADPARVRKLGGSGLGMAISLKDVRLHNGWLQVWGRPGAGANFRITLPLGGPENRLTTSPLNLIPRSETGGWLGGHPAGRSRLVARADAPEDSDGQL